MSMPDIAVDPNPVGPVGPDVGPIGSVATPPDPVPDKKGKVKPPKVGPPVLGGGPGVVNVYNPTPGDFALIRRVLDSAQLGSLYDWAVGLMVDGGFEDENQLYFALRDRPEFRTRFRGLLAREEQGLPPISVQEALAYENQAYQLFRSADLPPGFYDSPEDFQDLIAGNVSFNELNQRIAIYTEAAGAGREQIREELEAHSAGLGDAVGGLSDGDLAAWLLDKDRGLQAIRQRVSSAQVSAAARDVGFGPLGYDEATQIVGQGIEAAQTREAFAQLAAAGDVTGALAGEDAGSGMGRAGQLAMVRGVGESVAEFEARRRRRQGAFEGGGGFSTGQEGVVGVGSA